MEARIGPAGRGGGGGCATGAAARGRAPGRTTIGVGCRGIAHQCGSFFRGRRCGECAVAPTGEELFQKGEGAADAVSEQDEPGRADARARRDDREASAEASAEEAEDGPERGGVGVHCGDYI